MSRNPKIGDEPVPGYVLARYIGKGQFGQVWEAQTAGGIRHALKIIPQLEPTQGGKELKALEQLKNVAHPNLAPLIAYWLLDARGRVINLADSLKVDEATGRPPEADTLIIAMGLGERNLFERFEEAQKEGKPGIEPLTLLGYLDAAARGLDFLNGRHGIQHCDVKPHNILEIGGSAQVCDFGLAKVIGGDVRKTSSFAGSMAYCAPEVSEGGPSKNSDQYSLAVTYYELRTGRFPYAVPPERLNLTNVLMAKIRGQLDLSAVSPEEAHVLGRALALKAEERFDSCVRFINLLRKCFPDEDATFLQKMKARQAAPPLERTTLVPAPQPSTPTPPAAKISAPPAPPPAQRPPQAPETAAPPAKPGKTAPGQAGKSPPPLPADTGSGKDEVVKTSIVAAPPKPTPPPAPTEKPAPPAPAKTPREPAAKPAPAAPEKRPPPSAPAEHTLVVSQPRPEKKPFAAPTVYDAGVRFTVRHPAQLEAGPRYKLLAFAHLAAMPPGAPAGWADPLAEIQKRAERLLGPLAAEATGESTAGKLPRGGLLSFVPHAHGVRFHPAQVAVPWQAPLTEAVFEMWATGLVFGKPIPCCVHVYAGGILLAEVRFEVRVVNAGEAESPQTGPRHTATNARFPKVFVAFASNDTEAAAAFAAHAPHAGEFAARCVALRQGALPRPGVQKLIREADAFQLCWSTQGLKSVQLREEWEYALLLNRPHFVRPVYWEHPRPEDREAALPSGNLSRLHFDFLGRLTEEQARKAATGSDPGASQFPPSAKATPPALAAPTPAPPSARKPAPTPQSPPKKPPAARPVPPAPAASPQAPAPQSPAPPAPAPKSPAPRPAEPRPAPAVEIAASPRPPVTATPAKKFDETGGGRASTSRSDGAKIWAAGDQPVPGYRLVRRIGRGSFGEVWEALGPGRVPVAIKIVTDLDPQQGGTELRALQRVKQIRHPNIVPLFGYWVRNASGELLDDDHLDRYWHEAESDDKTRAGAAPQVAPTELYVVMGLGDLSLADNLSARHKGKSGGLPRADVLRYLRSTAVAIDYLNGQGLQHCDVKPANILTLGGEALLCDLGLAKAINRLKRSATTAGGTLAYGPHELFLKELGPTRQTDQFSLAVTYYELVTGELPYQSLQLGDVQKAKENDDFDLALVGPPEREVLRRALGRNPAGRYASAIELIERLEQAVRAGDLAKPSSPPAGDTVITPAIPAAAAVSARAPQPLVAGVAASPGQHAAPAPRHNVRTAVVYVMAMALVCGAAYGTVAHWNTLASVVAPWLGTGAEGESDAAQRLATWNGHLAEGNENLAAAESLLVQFPAGEERQARHQEWEQAEQRVRTRFQTALASAQWELAAQEIARLPEGARAPLAAEVAARQQAEAPNFVSRFESLRGQEKFAEAFALLDRLPAAEQSARRSALRQDWMQSVHQRLFGQRHFTAALAELDRFPPASDFRTPQFARWRELATFLEAAPALEKIGSLAAVPDSLVQPLCQWLERTDLEPDELVPLVELRQATGKRLEALAAENFGEGQPQGARQQALALCLGQLFRLAALSQNALPLSPAVRELQLLAPGGKPVEKPPEIWRAYQELRPESQRGPALEAWLLARAAADPQLAKLLLANESHVTLAGVRSQLAELAPDRLLARLGTTLNSPQVDLQKVAALANRLVASDDSTRVRAAELLLDSSQRLGLPTDAELAADGPRPDPTVAIELAERALALPPAAAGSGNNQPLVQRAQGTLGLLAAAAPALSASLKRVSGLPGSGPGPFADAAAALALSEAETKRPALAEKQIALRYLAGIANARAFGASQGKGVAYRSRAIGLFHQAHELASQRPPNEQEQFAARVCRPAAAFIAQGEPAELAEGDRGPAARLLAASARRLPPAEAAAQLELAARFERRPEYLVARGQLLRYAAEKVFSDADWRTAQREQLQQLARALAPEGKYDGASLAKTLGSLPPAERRLGFALVGEARALAGWMEKNPAQQLAAYREAVENYRQAIAEWDALSDTDIPRSEPLARDFLAGLSRAELLLGLSLPADRAEKVIDPLPDDDSRYRYLHAAEQHAERATRLAVPDGSSAILQHQAWLALGSSREDLAYYLHEYEYFPRSLAAFDEAQKHCQPGSPEDAQVLWYRGRCRLRYAQAFDARLTRPVLETEGRQLAEAERSVRDLTQGTVHVVADQKAEALFWLWLAERFRNDLRQRTGTTPTQQSPSQAP